MEVSLQCTSYSTFHTERNTSLYRRDERDQLLGCYYTDDKSRCKHRCV